MSTFEVHWLTAAASLWERLDALDRCDCAPACGLGAAPDDLAGVVQSLGGPGPTERWLARAGFSDRGIAAVLTPGAGSGTECVARHVATLPWARCAQDALAVLEAMEPRVLEPPPGTTVPLFPEITAPLVRAAARRVALPGRPGFDAALAHARVLLWRELGKLFQLLLAADFQAGRAESAPRFLRTHADSAASASYRRWLLEFRDSRARAVAADYPVLFRLVGEAITSWVAATSELFDRLADDWPRLAGTFGFDPSAGLDEAVFGLSDPHDRGRQVVQLRAGNRQFYYKPRSIDGEVLWLGLLGALTAGPGRGPYRSGLAPAPLLACDGYGYVAEAAHTPIDRDRVEGYHRELGAVLALFYAVNGTDGHMENLVASHGHPVIVDLETLLDAPTAATELPGTGLFAAAHGWTYLQSHSVASTGLLPHWVEWDDRVIDYSGIGAHAADNAVQVAKRIVVENHGSADLSIRQETVTGGSAPSVPLCDGAEVAATDHVDAVVAGFRDGYRCVERERDRLAQLCATGAASRSVRQVLRPTRRYAAVADKLLAPRWLTSGVTRTAGLLHALHQQWMDRSAMWPRVVVAEARALDRRDIPLFTTRIDEVVLRRGGEPVGPWCAETPLASLRAKLQGLGPADLALQSRMIRLSFAARVAGSSAHATEGAAPAGTVGPPEARTDGLDHVGAVARRLEQDAIDLGHGSAWLTLAYDAQTERYDYRLADHGIFSGSAGTAMFLAASSRVAPTGALAVRALAHSVEHLAGAADLTPAAHALSVLRTAYAAAWVLRYGLGDESVQRRIQAAVAAIEPSVLRADDHLDVLFGAASGLLAAARAGEVFRWPRLRDCAEVCAETLLAAQQVDGVDAGGWRTDTFPDQAITGFSHGAAGIVYALAAAGPRDDPRVVRAVERGLRFEASCFDERSGTWQRRPDTDSHGVSWCHGAPGIGLARAGLIRAGWDEPAVRQDLARAVAATSRHATTTDTFCCGAVGAAELLLAAADVGPSPGLAEDGRALLAGTVLRRGPGRYELGTSTNAVCHPGLYQGWPGIAYGLLRAFGPGCPSFALWDLPAAGEPGPRRARRHRP